MSCKTRPHEPVLGHLASIVSVRNEMRFSKRRDMTILKYVLKLHTRQCQSRARPSFVTQPFPARFLRQDIPSPQAPKHKLAQWRPTQPNGSLGSEEEASATAASVP